MKAEIANPNPIDSMVSNPIEDLSRVKIPLLTFQIEKFIRFFLHNVYCHVVVETTDYLLEG